MMLKLVLAAVLVGGLVLGENDPSSTVPYACTTANGTAPDSSDDTCRRFWECEDFNISLRFCPQGQAYSWYTGSCVNQSSVPCQSQNEAFNETLANQTTFAATRTRRSVDFNATTINANNTSSATIPSSSNGTVEVEIGKLEPIIVNLGKETCARIGHNVQSAERVANNALHLFTHCVFHHCDIETLKFVCQ